MPRTRFVSPVDVYTPKNASLVRLKVERLRRRGALPRGERADVGQTLWLKLAEATRTFDPARGSFETFADRVLERRVIDLVRRVRAAKRDRRRERSVEGELDERLRLRGPRSQAKVELRLDVENAIGRLPPPLRPLAELLRVETVTGVMRRTGWSRQQVRGRCRQIASHFERLGVVPQGLDRAA